MTTSTPTAPPTTPALTIDRHEYVALLGIKSATFERLRAARKVLPPLPLFSRTKHRWLRSDVIAWISAGCPDPATWKRSQGTRTGS